MTNKIALAAFTLLFSATVLAQTKTNVAVLEKTAEIRKIAMEANRQKALALAKQKGWQPSFTTRNGGLAVLVGVDPFGLPIYYSTENNVIAAATTGTSQLWVGGSSGLNLNGSSSSVTGKMAIWDGGKVLVSHVELAGRVIQRDYPSDTSDHSTHVAGTMIASGVNPNVKGMAYGFQELNAYDYANDDAEMSAAAPNLLLSNHSYGPLSGWNYNSTNSRWEFYGSTNENEDYKFGWYGTSSQMWDSIAYNAPYYLIVKSAGNNRGETGPAVGQPYWRYDASGHMVNAGNRPAGISSNDGYDILPSNAVAKNILTVGAVAGLPTGYTGASNVAMSSFSSWGPTDDGRIKPDIVADGVNVTSSVSTSNTSYGTMSGTSMASPNATGSLLLLQEYYAQLHGGSFMRSATLKALAIHTAEEAGPSSGPDYKFGWGLLNVAKASTVLQSKNVGTHQVYENVLNNGSTFTLNVIATGAITATLVWTDPAATPTPDNVLNNRSLKLVNDLDMRITQAGSTYQPWILDPGNPDNAATTGDNFRDNVEKIQIASPIVGQAYTIQITHKGALARGSQAFSLVVSGVGGQVLCASAPTSNAGARIDSVSFGAIHKLNSGGCTTYSDFSSVSTSVEPNQILPLTVKLGSCDGSVADKVVKIFIDYNNNGNFTDAGELAATSGVINGNGTFTGTITIPSTVVVGSTTMMRIIVQETSNPADVSSCGAYGRGETQDYKISFSTPTNNLMLEAVVDPSTTTCGNTSQLATVKIRNTGLSARSNFPLALVIKDGGNTVATLNGTYSGTINAGETKQYTFQAPFTLPGGTTYALTAYVDDPMDQTRSNDTLRTTVTIPAAPAAPTGSGSICGTSATLFVANPSSSNYYWYDSPTSELTIGKGFALNTTVIPANSTYYVSTGAKVSVGLTSKSAFPNGGGYVTNTTGYMKFNAVTPVVLERVKLYTKYPGKVTFIVADITSETATNYQYTALSSTTIDVLASSPNPAPGAQPGYDAADNGLSYPVNLVLPAGDHAIIVKTQGDANLFVNNNVTGNPYPFTIPGIISLNGNSAISEGTGTYQNYYYYLYDMKVRTTSCPSPRAPIVATVAPTPAVSQSGNQLVSSIDNGNQWFLNGTAITGATGKTLTPTQSGSYTVTVTDINGCQRTSAVFSYVVTAIPVVNDPQFNLQAVPNPNTGSFTLSFKAGKKENIQIELLSAYGQLVYNKQLSNYLGAYSEQLHLEHLAPGVYVLKVQYGDKVQYKKMVIE